LKDARLRLAWPPDQTQFAPKWAATAIAKIEIDGGEPVGTVHVFDIVQTETSGQRGGIRVGAVVIP
jgi:hypothetical protein